MLLSVIAFKFLLCFVLSSALNYSYDLYPFSHEIPIALWFLIVNLPQPRIICKGILIKNSLDQVGLWAFLWRTILIVTSGWKIYHKYHRQVFELCIEWRSLSKKQEISRCHGDNCLSKWQRKCSDIFTSSQWYKINFQPKTKTKTPFFSSCTRPGSFLEQY